MALYGREAERERIGSLIDAARGGGGEALLIRGEAGAGKSALLGDAIERAEGMRVLSATGIETERELSFGALHQLLHADLERLDELPGPQADALRACFGLAGGGAPPDRFAVSLAVLTLLGAIAGAEPVLCAIDDIQWIDTDSLDAILFVTRRLSADGICLLLALRDGEGAPTGRLGLPEIQLAPLEGEAVSALLAEAAKAPVGAQVARELCEQTAGNPLALTELAAELTSEQLGGTEPLPAPLPVGAGIERTYAGRIAALDASQKTALLVAAAQGDGPVSIAERAAAALGAGEGALEDVERRGFIDSSGGRIRFRHPLVRSTAYAAFPAAERRRAHAALAAEYGDDPERRAWQLAAAAVGPDPRVAGELEALAGRARSRGAAATSSAAGERAAELTADPRHRAALLSRAADDAWRGGHGDRALVLIGRARDADPSPEDTALLNRLQGTIEAWGGRPAEGIEILCSQAEASRDTDPLEALELLAEAAETASFTVDGAMLDRVGRVAAAIEVDGDGENPRVLLLRRLLEGTTGFAAGHVAEAVPRLLEAIGLGERIGDPVALNYAGRAAIYLGDEAASLALDRRAAGVARSEGAIFTMPSILVRTAISELRTGRLAAAETSASEAVGLAEATGQTDLVACGLAFAAFIAAERGDEQPARERAARAIEAAEQRGLRLFADIARGALAHLELSLGEPERALALLQPQQHPGAVLISLLDRAEAASAAGRPDAAAAATAAAAELAGAGGGAALEAGALHCRALAAPAAEASALLGKTVAAYERIERPFERARAQLALGAMLRRGRQRQDARPHLRAAHEGFEQVGARLWAERAAAELRASGQTARRRDPTTIDDLTPQEIQVARLVAGGATNKEVAAQLFLSPRTIDFHLRNVFRKLGLRSRTELARIELRDDGPVSPPEAL